MIYTVTLNPGLDYTAEAGSMAYKKTNRTTNEYIVPGGKGINVSILLSRLGLETTAICYKAGFTGEELERLVKEEGVQTEFIPLSSGFTRINVKLVSKESDEKNAVTEYNGSGAKLTETEIEMLKEKVSLLKKEDVLVLSGSIPAGVSKSLYAELMQICPAEKIIVDASGEALMHALSEKPYLIKPNDEEIEELFSVKADSLDVLTDAAKKLQEMGAKNVLISLGKDGALLLTEEGEVYRAPAPEGKVLNTVGAGDSMLAGFIAAIDRGQNKQEALKLGLAAGSATAFSVWLAEKETIWQVYNA